MCRRRSPTTFLPSIVNFSRLCTLILASFSTFSVRSLFLYLSTYLSFPSLRLRLALSFPLFLFLSLSRGGARIGTAPLPPSGVTAPTDSGWSFAGTLVHSGGQRSDGARTPAETPESRPVSWLPGGSRLHRSCAGAAILHSSGSMTVVHELSRVSWLCAAFLSLSLSRFARSPLPAGALAFSPHRRPSLLCVLSSLTDSIHISLSLSLSPSIHPLNADLSAFPRISSRAFAVSSPERAILLLQARPEASRALQQPLSRGCDIFASEPGQAASSTAELSAFKAALEAAVAAEKATKAQEKRRRRRRWRWWWRRLQLPPLDDVDEAPIRV